MMDEDSIHRFNPERGPCVFDAIPPTDRMVRYAEALAENIYIEPPPNIYWNRGACGAFINEMQRRQKGAATE